MGPTSKIVESTECAQARPVARPMSLNLDNQFARDTENHVEGKSFLINQAPRTRVTVLTWLLLVGMLICSSTLTGAVDTYTSEAERSPQVDYYYQEKNRQAAAERQEQFRKRVSIQHAVGENVPHAFVKIPVENTKAIAAQPRSDSDEVALQGILLTIAMFLTLVMAVRMLAPEFFKSIVKRFNPWSDNSTKPTNHPETVRAEDKAFAEFLTTFQAGSVVASSVGSRDAINQSGTINSTQPFYTNVARLLGAQRALLQKISVSISDSERIRMLADLRRELNVFRNEATSTDFLPAWQLASALDGLLKQLCEKVGNATQSTLRTVAAAVDLLAELIEPGVRRDILTNPPVRFLAVDDDMISRTAVSMALKKIFSSPDIADSGKAALCLVDENEYDAIFLDVQMSGMDGYELCSRIRETSTNKDTPVIFVTCMSDFDSRAQSILTGGSDLIGKPFLTFEITVKALTLALGRRLRPRSEPVIKQEIVPAAARSLSDAALAHDSAKEIYASKVGNEVGEVIKSSELLIGIDHHGLVIHNTALDIDDVASGSGDKLEDTFLTRAAKQLGELKDLIRSTSETTEETTRQEMLAEFYLSLNALSPEMDSGTRHPAMAVSSALEGLIRKLLENPENWTASMLLTITNAVDLMDDLCAVGTNVDLGADSPIHILAVDDDVISRRAVVGALQVAFEKPESVESGAAALILATERPFDLIFMDVQMPGMDGFEACSKIRQTNINGVTPIVFVSGKADANTRVQVATSGGNGLISKPFLTAEVTVKALTFALRGRLEKSIPANTIRESLVKTEAMRVTKSRRARKRQRVLQNRVAAT